jgi:porin
MKFVRKIFALACVAGIYFSAIPNAHALPPPISTPASGDELEESNGVFGFLNGANRSQALLGDMWGLRKSLSNYGISLGIQDIEEYLGNTMGGAKQGYGYDGLTQVLLQMDTNRAFGHYGGLFSASFLNIRGALGGQNYNVQALQTISGIEAETTTRLWELWYDQKFLEEDRLDVKIGQQSLDQEYMVSSNALYFVNTMFGWATLPSYNMPGGGPAYPLASLGVRLSARPIDGVQLLAGVYNGAPAKQYLENAQLNNLHGMQFGLGQGTLSIVEAQFSYPSLGSMVSPGQSQPLGWTYKIGAWYNSLPFADQRFDSAGFALSDEANTTGNAQMHKGNYSIYAVADQLIWRSETDPNRTLALFTRVMGAPQQDRNAIALSANLGVLMRSPFKNRPADTFGLGFGYAQVSSSYANATRDAYMYSGTSGAIPNNELMGELTYQYQVKPWFVLQPDIQYIYNPGAGIPNPNSLTGARLQNELIAGVRAIFNF